MRRVPSGGNSDSALVRIVIQCAASHGFAGKLKGAKVLPALKTSVSPHEADCRAAATPLGSETFICLPGDGEELRAVLIQRFGNAAGPSLLATKIGGVAGAAISVIGLRHGCRADHQQGEEQ